MDKKWNVTVYIDQTVRGLQRQDGIYAYAIEYIAENGKKSVKYGMEYEKEITAHEMELIAITDALRELNRSCIITLYSRHGFLRMAMMNHWIDRWKQNDWMNAHGEKVKNHLTWQALSRELDKHTMAVAGTVYADTYNLVRKLQEERGKEDV